MKLAQRLQKARTIKKGRLVIGGYHIILPRLPILPDGRWVVGMGPRPGTMELTYQRMYFK